MSHAFVEEVEPETIELPDQAVSLRGLGLGNGKDAMMWSMRSPVGASNAGALRPVERNDS